MPNRRQFLQMLGLGGAALVATKAKASPIVPLFSGKESKIWTPEHTRLTSSHVVLTRPVQNPWKVTDVGQQRTPWGDTINVGARSMQKFAWPKTTRHDLFHMDGGYNPALVQVEYGEGHDPHHAYYRAAMKMREDFAEHSRRRLLEVPEYQRPHSMLVTLVDTPIFASAGPGGPNKEILYAEISYTPYIIDANEELDLNGWEVYSENGEYPIEVPTEIDMDHLLKVEHYLYSGQLDPHQLHGKLLVSS